MADIERLPCGVEHELRADAAIIRSWIDVANGPINREALADRLDRYANAAAELTAEIEALRAEVERLRADLMESDEIREKLSHLLTRTAAALKCEPPEGVWHSWHDLPERASELQAEVERSERYAEQSERERLWAEERAERLAEALRGWWNAHRPVGWTEDQHRSCPHVNLATDAEKALATALLRDQEEGK